MIRSRSTFCWHLSYSWPRCSRPPACGSKRLTRPRALTAVSGDDPKESVCKESPPPSHAEAIRALCTAHPDRGRPARLGVAPATVSDLRAKNRYDDALRGFLRDRAYRKLGWISDRSWRLTALRSVTSGPGKAG